MADRGQPPRGRESDAAELAQQRALRAARRRVAAPPGADEQADADGRQATLPLLLARWYGGAVGRRLAQAAAHAQGHSCLGTRQLAHVRSARAVALVARARLRRSLAARLRVWLLGPQAVRAAGEVEP
eukprot:scaffold50300_cov63-Phaeocystis_antarctica.AAC.1